MSKMTSAGRSQLDRPQGRLAVAHRLDGAVRRAPRFPRNGRCSRGKSARLPVIRNRSSDRRPDDASSRRCPHLGQPRSAARPRRAGYPKGSAQPRSRRSGTATLRRAARSAAAPGKRRIGHSDSRRWASSTGHRLKAPMLCLKPPSPRGTRPGKSQGRSRVRASQGRCNAGAPALDKARVPSGSLRDQSFSPCRAGDQHPRAPSPRSTTAPGR